MSNEGIKQTGSENYQDRLEFDNSRSIHILRTHKIITPELQESILDGEFSYVEEGISAPQVRPYRLFYEREDVFDLAGNSMTETLANGLTWATTDITRRKAKADQIANENLKLMMSGRLSCNILVEFRPFPEESSTEENKEELISVGLQPDRKLGFASIYEKVDDRLAKVKCMSLDNTNAEIIRSLALNFGQFIPTDILTDEFQAYPLQLNGSADEITARLTQLFDILLNQKTGMQHRQGRLLSEIQEEQIEVHQFIKKQPELREWYWGELNRLAEGNLEGAQLDSKKKDLTYSFWARIKERYLNPEVYNREGRDNLMVDVSLPVVYRQLSREVWEAGNKAAARAERLIGCGGVMSREEIFTQLDTVEARSLILGGSDPESENIPSRLKCINPKCGKTSRKEEVVKKDCWECPHCGVKAICGKVIYPKDKNTQKEKVGKNSRQAFRAIAQTILESLVA